jgi:dTDP-3-amino-2,3,6-trideoxy-4-keto-D-glucose/dTDP-3-amino-3,4,6-trideoxy-alpha-D-glucose/dTDP-2,6-dideoxy-D-kanosamine transaminase
MCEKYHANRIRIVVQIPINDMKRHFAATREFLAPALERVLDSGWYILGSEGKTFEVQFAEYCGVRACVGVSNGTDALEFALRSVGVKTGSRVATVANAGFYTSTALLAIGAIPVFVDADRTTHLMDPKSLREVAAQGIDAVVVTHLYGLLCDMDELSRICNRYGLTVIEDCAQAHGAARKGKRAGSFGHAAAFSFYPTKNLGGLGDAGAVVTNDPTIAARVRLLRQYGWNPKYHVTMRGARNSRLDELQAAVLSAKLPYLDRWNARRREIAARYSRGLRNSRIKAPAVRGCEYVAHLYVVVCEDRDSLRAHLASAAVATEVHFPVPDHRQGVFAGNDQRPALPVSEWLSESVVTLPCFPELTDEETDFVIARANEW